MKWQPTNCITRATGHFVPLLVCFVLFLNKVWLSNHLQFQKASQPVVRLPLLSLRWLWLRLFFPQSSPEALLLVLQWEHSTQLLMNCTSALNTCPALIWLVSSPVSSWQHSVVQEGTAACWRHALQAEWHQASRMAREMKTGCCVYELC